MRDENGNVVKSHLNDGLLREIAKAAAMLMGAPVARFWIADETTQTLTLRAAYDETMVAACPLPTMRFDQSVVKAVVELGNIDQRTTLHEIVAFQCFPTQPLSFATSAPLCFATAI